jgi:hypothetical protein
MPDLPIACSLQPDELKKRADDLLPGLAKTATTCGPIEGGYRFEFASCTETLSTLLGVWRGVHEACVGKGSPYALVVGTKVYTLKTSSDKDNSELAKLRREHGPDHRRCHG